MVASRHPGRGVVLDLLHVTELIEDLDEVGVRGGDFQPLFGEDGRQTVQGVLLFQEAHDLLRPFALNFDLIGDVDLAMHVRRH